MLQFGRLTRAAVDCGPFQRFGGHRFRYHAPVALWLPSFPWSYTPTQSQRSTTICNKCKVFSSVHVPLVTVLKTSTMFCRLALDWPLHLPLCFDVRCTNLHGRAPKRKPLL
jgi:hypothetical protein